MSRRARSPDPWALLAIPVAAYALSYAYLASHHTRLWLWGAVVHESGRYTLLETTLYASHFLGHLPVLITIALVTAGSWRWLSPPPTQPRHRPVAPLSIGLVALLVASFALAVAHFGVEDTMRFLLQRRQRPDLDVEGGSWNLHLPSTMLQLALIPVVVWLARRMFRRPVVASGRGLGLLGAAVLLVLAVTMAVNRDPAAALLAVWTDPRYLAHSVRELATFPITYYPIPLAVLLAGERVGRSGVRSGGRIPWPIGVAAAVFAVGFGYQVVASLAHDIGALAQKPDFARGGSLTVPYLLASHAFEHVLDSIFFALLTVLLVWLTERCGQAEGAG